MEDKIKRVNELLEQLELDADGLLTKTMKVSIKKYEDCTKEELINVIAQKNSTIQKLNGKLYYLQDTQCYLKNQRKKLKKALQKQKEEFRSLSLSRRELIRLAKAKQKNIAESNEIRECLMKLNDAILRSISLNETKSEEVDRSEPEIFLQDYWEE